MAENYRKHEILILFFTVKKFTFLALLSNFRCNWEIFSNCVAFSEYMNFNKFLLYINRLKTQHGISDPILNRLKNNKYVIQIALLLFGKCLLKKIYWLKIADF